MTSLILRRSTATAGQELRLAAAAFVVLVGLAMSPILLAEIPASVDFPNHLARMSVLSRDGTAAAHPLYQTTWALYPNLAMDLGVPLLGRWIGIEAAAKLFYVVSQLLVISGAVALELAVKRRFQIAGLFALLYLYSIPFAWGFVNFQFGLGLALWAIAVWLWLQDRPRAVRFAIHAGITALLFASHLFALGLYGFVIGVHELWRARQSKIPWATSARTFAMLAAPPLCLLSVLKLQGGTVGGSGNVWGFGWKLQWLLLAINGYSYSLAILSTTALLILGRALARLRALSWEASGAWLTAALAALYLAMPQRLFDTSFVDVRVVVAAALILPAFLSVELADRRWRFGATACATAVVLVNAGFAAYLQDAYRKEYKAIIASFGALGERAAVLVGHSGDAPDPPRDLREYPMYHAPTLAVHYANAFVPTLFTQPGKQPVVPIPGYRALDIGYGAPEPVARLSDIAEGRFRADVQPYVADWPRDFDYLYVVGEPVSNLLPRLLEPLSSGSRFTLYRIRRGERS